MKRWFYTFLVMPLVFVACADKQGSDNTVAVAPPPASCINGSAYCNSNLYGQNNGYAAYPYNPYYYNPQTVWGQGGYMGNFCNCPVGHRPVYNGQYGLGCVAISQFQPVAYGAVYWGWGADNSQWVNIPQVSNSQGYPTNRNSSCFQNVAQSCFIDQVNSCGAGATCRTTGGGSRLGICVSAGQGTLPPNNGGGFR
ncbi:hypothetical protein [Bdellovibrio sp. HCB337]|uniref:hypothetical protein n=1 Tax=Bdellovibrio sp. HCB337 TaxID=3394358 RepID=UPI0039A7332B